MQRLAMLAFALLVLSWTVAAAEDQGTERQGPVWSAAMSGVPSGGGAALPLLLNRADFEVDVFGPLAVGMLAQEFSNVSAFDVAATYTGQSPPGFLVTSIEVERDGGVEELVPEEPAAKRKAKPGRTSTRLPSVTVASGETVTLRAMFQTSVRMVEGHFMLALPEVHGSSPAGDRIPVASSIQVRVHHDEPLVLADSATHDVFATFRGDHSLVELTEEGLESRPFRLELAMGAENDPDLMGFVGPETANGGRDIIMVLAPPAVPRDGSIRPKQVSFVLDTSGSMHGGKLDEARAALGGCLSRLRGEDMFNIFEFNTEYTAMSPQTRAATETTVGDGLAWMRELRRRGGTQLSPVLQAALEEPDIGDHHRMVVILTDGAMEDQAGVFSLLESSLGNTRLFVVGIGADVRRKTIEKMAAYGRGTVAFAEDAEGLNAAVTALFESVADPLAWDLSVNWGDAEVELVEPRRIPDLYAGRPVTIRARVRGELPPELTVHASTTDGVTSFTARMSEADSAMPRLARPTTKQTESRPKPHRP